ncbi:MAG: hypothetical protein HY515_00265 [Candidatus Aenigmarchaeota archaeon]|nr:hypothetical protein [Candidatus Aenigmarchaeota archaeon]
MAEETEHEARKFMRILFSECHPFTGYVDTFNSMVYPVMQMLRPEMTGKKEYDAISVACAVWQASCPHDDPEVATIFETHEKAPLGLRTAFDKVVVGRKRFEVGYDEDGFPIKYRQHTNGLHELTTPSGVYHVLEAGKDRGDFVDYKDIFEWLTKNNKKSNGKPPTT